MKICFVQQKMISFVKKDLDILADTHQVKNVEINSFLPTVNLFKAVLRCDLVFCWFGKMPAFWAILFGKILNKKTIVVAGGDDVINMPEINYGIYSFWWKKWCPAFVFKYCDLIISVSEFNKKETLVNTNIKSGKVEMVYHGFENNTYKSKTKLPQIITIGQITYETIKRKGLLLFVEASRILPEYKFILIGKCDDGSINKLKERAGDNIIFSGWVDAELLAKNIAESKIYVQASYHEAFGCSVAEAMLGGCIPVVARRAALPEVVGDTGFYIEGQTPEAVAEAIKKALAMPDDYGLKARQRIIENFPLKKRKEALLKAVDDVKNDVYG